MGKNQRKSLILFVFIVLSVTGKVENQKPGDDLQLGSMGKLAFEIRAQRSEIRVNQATELPAMVSIKSSPRRSSARSSVDLIVVVDVSGSMMGKPIDLAKKTLNYLVDNLTPEDRLSIITFSTSSERVTHLMNVTDQNKEIFLKEISKLAADGSTNIMSGMDLALSTILERKDSNKVTSIFLLSDGENNVGPPPDQTLKEVLEDSSSSELGSFSIHTFGFGASHDEILMTNICRLKQGEFYYIDELETLDEAFSSALGGIMSVVATNLSIQITNKYEQFKISKTYGPFWEKISKDKYKIKLEQLIAGVTKDFVFRLSIPAVPQDSKLLKLSNMNVIQARYTGQDLNGEALSGECTLKLQFVSSDVVIDQEKDDVDVLENSIRVKAAEIMKKSMEYAERGEYEQARETIQSQILIIDHEPRIRKSKMSSLSNDLVVIKEKLNQRDYLAGGRKSIVGSENAQIYQNSYQYGSSEQREMVNKAKKSKSK